MSSIAAFRRPQQNADKRSTVMGGRASGEHSSPKASTSAPLDRSQTLATAQVQQPASAAVSLPNQASMKQYGGQAGQPHQANRQRAQVAPLASLDCSITEPILDGSPGSRSADTPTLSGYFDCDQLSDMVDDSLFEITTAGCLSASVFKNSSNSNSSKTGNSVVINKVSKDSAAAEVDADADSESGSKTPTNEDNLISYRDNNTLSESKKKPDCQKEGDSKAQMTLLTNYQKPHHIENRHRHQAVPSSSDSPAAGVVNGHRQRSKSARFNSGNNVARCEPLADSDGVKTTPPAAEPLHRVRRKTRSNPDVRADKESENLCSICRQSGEPSSSASKKGKKKRFTFSLFNLFTSNTSAGTSDNQSAVKREEICRHHSNPGKQSTAGAGQRGAQQSSSNGDQVRHASANRRGHRHRFFESSTNSASSGIGTQIKSRDSIKLTNQRKRRNNAVRLSTSYNDFHDEPTELLLDFSGQPIASGTTLSPPGAEKPAGSELRSSQSSNNIRFREGSIINGSGSSDGSLSANRLQQRQTKSVKFTTPDRVMILPTSLNKSSGCCSNLPPPADRLPSAPIIKRPVPKASSYSQTESNKGLLELLAKYEGNTELIMEINEKLKLTETIASPISTLDQVVSPTDENPRELTLDELGQSQTQLGGVQTCCEPVNFVKQNSSEAEEAGFSIDWVAKQRALV